MSLVTEGQSHFSGFAFCLYYSRFQTCQDKLTMQPHFPASAYNPARRFSKKISSCEWIFPQPWRCLVHFFNTHHCQIQHFEQTVIRGRDRLCFRDFPQLPVKSLNGIGRTTPLVLYKSFWDLLQMTSALCLIRTFECFVHSIQYNAGIPPLEIRL